MTYHPLDTYCVDQTLTPRVRIIFRSKTPAQPPPPPASPAARGDAPKELGWHQLICALLESLFPFPDAYSAARRALDDFGKLLPAHSDYPRSGPILT